MLVKAYQGKIFNLCLKMLGHYEDARDTAQDVFIKVFKALARFRQDASFSTWIYRIAVNTCKNKLTSARRRFHKRFIPLDKAVDTGDGEVHKQVKNPGPSPAASLHAKQVQARVLAAIHALPADRKTVVLLRDMEGLSYQEIGAITGWPLGTVKSKLARAREALRLMLKDVIYP